MKKLLLIILVVLVLSGCELPPRQPTKTPDVSLKEAYCWSYSLNAVKDIPAICIDYFNPQPNE